MTIKKPMLLLPVGTLMGLLIALYVARAPTSYTGKWPIIGENLPIELDAVSIIMLGPIVGALLAGAIWVLIANGWGASRSTRILANQKNEGTALAVCFVLMLLVETLLSAQYFLILAPANLCPSRPHIDFLWTNFPTPERATHCMSGTAEINKKTPYYLEPPIIQAWGHVLWPFLTLCLLLSAWRAWRRQDAASKR